VSNFKSLLIAKRAVAKTKRKPPTKGTGTQHKTQKKSPMEDPLRGSIGSCRAAQNIKGSHVRIHCVAP